VLSISVILPTHDRPEFLLEALQCVRRQTHPELELILVRDGGGPHSDDVRALLGQFEFPVTLIEHDGDSGGAARARNQGVERARGDAIAFIDDDDLWEPGHAYALAGALESHPEADVVYSDSVILNTATDGTRILARDFDAGRFVRDGFIPPSAMAARREAFERFGPFDPEFTLTEDWEWLIRVVRGGGVLRRVPGRTATIRIHGGALSALNGDRLEARRRTLALLAERYALKPIEPKTFWEVAGAP
jgi:glycosyltransferase involved in cell wall biosynthesis